MSAPRLELDFAARRRTGGLAGGLLALAGCAALGFALWQQHALRAEQAGLELRRTALERHSGRGQMLADAAHLQAAQKTVTELATPWSLLLAELEKAGGDSKDKVAVLTVEPDHVKHRVKVAAEARTLQIALGYVERLRQSPVLHYPMLDSHEIKTDDKDRPVHFELSADWSDST